MRAKDFITESPEVELAKKLPSLAKHDYDTIDKLMKKVSKKHKISGKALHNLFVKKYKDTPDHWIKNKLDEKQLTTEDIKKTILKRVGENNDILKIRSVYEDLSFKHYGRKVINSTAAWVNNLLPHIYENVDPEIKEFYNKLQHYSKNSHVPVKIGAKLCLLQVELDIYSHTVILKGFKNPKKIVNISYDDGKIKQLEFDDGSVFPEKYEYSTTEMGYDLLNTMFFTNANDLEKTITILELIKPDNYKIGSKLLTENKDTNLDIQQEVEKFVNWASKILHLKNIPTIELSNDTKEAQDNHHTGGHMVGSDKIWVYVKNRNLVDILRTIAHELTHVRQGELDMIKNGSSYPGSPIELLADMAAGKLIKIYGKKNHHIFQ
jgi:hypothetical protein